MDNLTETSNEKVIPTPKKDEISSCANDFARMYHGWKYNKGWKYTPNQSESSKQFENINGNNRDILNSWSWLDYQFGHYRPPQKESNRMENEKTKTLFLNNSSIQRTISNRKKSETSWNEIDSNRKWNHISIGENKLKTHEEKTLSTSNKKLTYTDFIKRSIEYCQLKEYHWNQWRNNAHDKPQTQNAPVWSEQTLKIAKRLNRRPWYEKPCNEPIKRWEDRFKNLLKEENCFEEAKHAQVRKPNKANNQSNDEKKESFYDKNINWMIQKNKKCEKLSKELNETTNTASPTGISLHNKNPKNNGWKKNNYSRSQSLTKENIIPVYERLYSMRQLSVPSLHAQNPQKPKTRMQGRSRTIAYLFKTQRKRIKRNNSDVKNHLSNSKEFIIPGKTPYVHWTKAVKSKSINKNIDQIALCDIDEWYKINIYPNSSCKTAMTTIVLKKSDRDVMNYFI